MKMKTTFSEFRDIAKLKRPVAISIVIQADQFTPTAIFEKVYDYFQNGSLIEVNHEDDSKVLMGFNPRGFFKFKNHVCESSLDGKNYCFKGDALEALRNFKALANVELGSVSQGLSGGISGLVSYDAISLFEEKLNYSNLEKNTFQFLFYSYNVNLTFNPKKYELTLSTIAKVDGNLKQSYEESMILLGKLQEILEKPVKQKNTGGTYTSCIEVDISDLDYQALVTKAKAYIQSGDIFQVVLSRSFSQSYQSSPFKIYRTLRKLTPTPYLFYMDHGEEIILGASPEKLVSVKNNDVETVPIAGTCKGVHPGAVHALLADEKELAEHMMLVDLSRNDLGKVCIAGSIKVEQLLTPKIAGNLTHLTTVVNGKLANAFDAFDALKSVFPAGTVSGAPKIRAMEIIDELETTGRNFYGGAFCFMDGFGNLDSALMIRTMILKNGIATVRAGAGIVSDSIPKKEAEESEAKALSILRAIQLTSEETYVVIS